MSQELILISGKELKDLITQGNTNFLYMNGYKYFFSSVDLEKLEDSSNKNNNNGNEGEWL